MRARPALLASAVLALAGCGHTRSTEPRPTRQTNPTQQTTTVMRTVTTTATVTQTVATSPTPETAPAPAHAPAPARRLADGRLEDGAKFPPTDAAARGQMQSARSGGARAVAFSAFLR